MKLCRYNEDRLGVVDGDFVYDVSSALELIPVARYPYPKGDQLIANLHLISPVARKLKSSSEAIPIAAVKLMAPVSNPAKIIGAPINYRAHIEESISDKGISFDRKVSGIRDWGLFLKSSTSLVGFGEEIILRRPERRNDHECELAIVIGKKCNRVKREEALQFVAGYTIGLDMTVRGPEFQCWRKSVDTYSVLGPWLVTADEITRPDELDIALQVNGEFRQSANTNQLILDVASLIEMATTMYTLYPGDVIMTGTPAGVGPVSLGDRITASIAGIGKATIRVARHYG